VFVLVIPNINSVYKKSLTALFKVLFVCICLQQTQFLYHGGEIPLISIVLIVCVLSSTSTSTPKSLTKTLLHSCIFIKTLFSMFIKPFSSRRPLAAPHNQADFRFYYA